MLVHQMFGAQARRTPEVTALAGAGLSLSYRELDLLTDTVAARLVEAGVRPESIVGCWSDTSIATVVQILAVLKAGGAYLLLDRHLPADRISYMISDTDPLCMLGDRNQTGVQQLDQMTITVSQNVSPSPASAPLNPDNLAYVAYTSGSTGRPKGVLITHGAVANHARAFGAAVDLGPGDRLPLMAPTAFDMATEEILPPLLHGCTLLQTPDLTDSLQRFTADVVDNGYTVLNIPAPLWHRWTTYLHDSETAVPETLRLVIAGSDKIYTSKLDEWKALPGAENVRWVAAYGVTEATVTSMLYLTAAQDDLSDEPLVPIGTPLENVTASIEHQGTPGEVGELCLGGAGIARGYHHMPEKTAQCFLHRGDERIYRTGDLVRRRHDGTFVWIGRRDSQIKINGLRIEPAEIEASIQQHPLVDDAVVVFEVPAGLDDSGRLVAYVATAAPAVELSAFLAARLHPLMLPDDVVVLDALPVNANGKIDRRALESTTIRRAS